MIPRELTRTIVRDNSDSSSEGDTRHVDGEVNGGAQGDNADGEAMQVDDESHDGWQDKGEAKAGTGPTRGRSSGKRQEIAPLNMHELGA